jgi:hypothetical protein
VQRKVVGLVDRHCGVRVLACRARAITPRHHSSPFHFAHRNILNESSVGSVSKQILSLVKGAENRNNPMQGEIKGQESYDTLVGKVHRTAPLYLWECTLSENSHWLRSVTQM